mmetsp:Transcript_115876/g.188776  ORF Transcript_115876/g.188776 Transcript_115876/m.188776 type:complete len:246 (-) Transcript_115876:1105-1842(-)
MNKSCARDPRRATACSIWNSTCIKTGVPAKPLQLIVGLLLIFFGASTATTATTCTIVLGNNGSTNAFNFLVFLFDLFCICLRIGIDPRLTILQGIHDLLFLLRLELFTESLVIARALNCGTHRMNVAIKCILCINTLLDLLVFISKQLCILDHLLDLLFCQAALVVGNCDFLALSSALVLSTNIQNSVRVNFKCHLDLRLTARCRRNSPKLKLTKQVVVLGHRSLTLEDLDVHCWLVVLVRRKDL